MTTEVSVYGENYYTRVFWCYENFGPVPVVRNGCERWGVDISKANYRLEEYVFWFRDERDAVMFLLRWA